MPHEKKTEMPTQPPDNLLLGAIEQRVTMMNVGSRGEAEARSHEHAEAAGAKVVWYEVEQTPRGDWVTVLHVR